MKHIKTYKLFENDSNDDIKEYMSDILISLDNNFEYTINEKFPDEIYRDLGRGKELPGSYSNEEFIVKIRDKEKEGFNLKPVAIDLLQLIRYMEGVGYIVKIWGRSKKDFKKEYREVEVDKLTTNRVFWKFINLDFTKNDDIIL